MTGEHIVDVRRFLAGVLAEVPADAVIGCDRYRRAELLDVLAGLEYRAENIRWRGVGASATADGSFDVRAFQAAVARGEIRALPNR